MRASKFIALCDVDSYFLNHIFKKICFDKVYTSFGSIGPRYCIDLPLVCCRVIWQHIFGNKFCMINTNT